MVAMPYRRARPFGQQHVCAQNSVFGHQFLGFDRVRGFAKRTPIALFACYERAEGGLRILMASKFSGRVPISPSLARPCPTEFNHVVERL
jgi:hypothetical protein